MEKTVTVRDKRMGFGNGTTVSAGALSPQRQIVRSLTPINRAASFARTYSLTVLSVIFDSPVVPFVPVRQCASRSLLSHQAVHASTEE